jgi:hypothetical protein
LEAALVAFDPLTLAELDRSGLMDRSELKYLLPEAMLPTILAGLGNDYRVLTIGARRTSRYRTLYFDTAGLGLYMRHHAGAPDRFKIRSREYLNSQEAFFEIKHRTPDRRTQKRRIATSGLLAAPDATVAGFLSETSPYSAFELRPSLWNLYTRITLVRRTRPERVTLDLDVEYAGEGASLGLPGIVIAEVKYDRSAGLGSAWRSPFVIAMRKRGLRATAFSKYCIGLSRLRPDLKHNRFKPGHLALERTLRFELAMRRDRVTDSERQVAAEALERGGGSGYR